MPRRLIEEAFPLQKVSADSKHEKNVRHGHISTLHIWPARRPLAACRAVTIATLLPDPADAPEKMKAEYTRLAGSPLPEKQREYLCNDLIASLTRWGDENGHGDWDRKDKKGRYINKLRIARELILMAYDGDPPKVMDMFAGGGAIPFEAMRLGCQAIANDYNPVAWFILKCTLEYPQRLAGKTAPLPNLNLDEKPNLEKGDLADHVRLWGQWVLENARKELVQYYPTVDDKPTVAYLWARTIPCQDRKDCGGTIPLLKTLWVCKKAEKTLKDTPENRNRPDFLHLKTTKNRTKVIINGKRALKLCPDRETKQVRFEIITPENINDVGDPTMTGSNAICPFCDSQQPTDYIKRCGHDGELKTQMTTVVYQEEYGKEYRPPTLKEMIAAEIPAEVLEAIANEIPYGIPNEPLPSKERHRAVGSQLPDYGFKTWANLFTNRQLLALTIFVKWTRTAQIEMKALRYSTKWLEAVAAYLASFIDKTANRNSQQCFWIVTNAEKAAGSFGRFALPMGWDFVEVYPWSHAAGGTYRGLKDIVEWIGHAMQIKNSQEPFINQQSSKHTNQTTDVIITDPPYYDAIPYADLSDFFYVWLRRSIGDCFSSTFKGVLSPKPDELVQQHRTGERGRIGKKFYEKGMAESFRAAHDSLCEDGRMVIVFAHKTPEAWETLTTAMIGAGLIVTASWPINTERSARLQSQKSAALATSLWLVCRKRPANVKNGRYSQVKSEMQKRITERLRYFWDEGIRGPDFVWAAIGPALESYASYKEVKRMDGKAFTVTEFLTEVRRIVTDFALGQILHGTSTEALDEWTRYYLMHKDYFGTENAPVGECILLAQGYGVSLDDLSAAHVGILKKMGSGNARKLLGHTERTSDRIGYAHTSGRIPMIDMIHRIMKFWDANESAYINAYFHEHGLQEDPLFKAVVQALIETSPQGSSERSLLETLIGYEPGEPVSGVLLPGQSNSEDERQLTFEGVLSE